MPIVYVRDMDEIRRFSGMLGMTVQYVAGHDRGRVELQDGGAVLALHRPTSEEEPALQLTFVSEKPLDEAAHELAAAGCAVRRPVTDEAFGHFMTQASINSPPAGTRPHGPPRTRHTTSHPHG